METENTKENPTEGMSVTERRKYFEQEIKHQSTGAPRKGPVKQFSYLSDHEVERMKQEDDQKVSNMSHEELLEYMSPDQETEYNQILANLDPRMKSLDDAALRAKAVIDKAHELSQNVSLEEAKQKANQFSSMDIAFADADSSEETGTTQNGESDNVSSVSTQPVHSDDVEGSCFGSLTLRKKDGDTRVRKSVKVLDETVSEHTEEVFDETLGKNVLKTFKFIEKTLEHEVEVTKKQIYELKLEDGESGQRINSNESKR